MRNSVFDFIDNLDTLLAVIVGAMLATGGALVAELVQDRLGQKRRERDAARFFGEILASVDLILDRGFATLEIGERWGDVTQRMFRTAMNEATIYERNRERLFDIRDTELRRLIHVHFLTEMVPLSAILDRCREITALEKDMQYDAGMSAAKREAMMAELQALNESRENALRGVQSEHAKTEAICQQLEPLAGVTF